MTARTMTRDGQRETATSRMAMTSPAPLGATASRQDFVDAVERWIPGAWVYEGLNGEIEILTGLAFNDGRLQPLAVAPDL